MAKQVHGDETIDVNTDKVTTWVKEKILKDPNSYCLNLSGKRLENLEEVIIELYQKVLPDIQKYKRVRMQQSPHYQKKLAEAANNELNLE